MSRNGKAGPAPAGGWLDRDEQRAWLAHIRVQLRLAYEMNRQRPAAGTAWHTAGAKTTVRSG